MTRAGRQLIDAPDRLEVVYLEWMESVASELPKPDRDGFMPWAGGTIPVHPRTKVAVKLRGGFALKGGSMTEKTGENRVACHSRTLQSLGLTQKVVRWRFHLD